MENIKATTKTVYVHLLGNRYVSSLTTLQSLIEGECEPVRVIVLAYPHIDKTTCLIGFMGNITIVLKYKDLESFTVADAVRVLNDSLTGKM